MAKKKAPPPPATDFPPEERRAEAATIAWMLCTLFTFCAEAVGLISKIVLSYYGGQDQPLVVLRLLPDVTLFMGLVAGIVVLVLTPIVYRLRQTPPPESIGFVAVLVGLTPLATLVIQWLRG